MTIVTIEPLNEDIEVGDVEYHNLSKSMQHVNIGSVG